MLPELYFIKGDASHSNDGVGHPLLAPYRRVILPYWAPQSRHSHCPKVADLSQSHIILHRLKAVIGKINFIEKDMVAIGGNRPTATRHENRHDAMKVHFSAIGDLGVLMK